MNDDFFKELLRQAAEKAKKNAASQAANLDTSSAAMSDQPVDAAPKDKE